MKKIRVLLVFIVIMLLGLGAIGFSYQNALADSQKVRNPENEHWYQRIDTPMNWHVANNYCVAQKGYLVTIGSASEDAFVYSLNPFGWIGFTDELQEGNWQWVTGEPVTYTNWASGEPDNCGNGCGGHPPNYQPENYVHFEPSGWNDWYDGASSFVCEWNCVLSGTTWVNQFPGSKLTSDLVEPFKTKTNRFISALRSAGARVTIGATYRPPQRSYLMHYSFMIAKNGLDPRNVPPMDGVNICWAHTRSDGSFDPAASKNAALQMVNGYGITSTVAPSLTSNHTKRLAIDMNISWSGILKIKNASGMVVTIASTPKSGMNPSLWAVGKTYGILHYLNAPKDPPHWSYNGH